MLELLTIFSYFLLLVFHKEDICFNVLLSIHRSIWYYNKPLGYIQNYYDYYELQSIEHDDCQIDNCHDGVDE
ncbi:hypothetical protein DERF_005228 [Dermatophagoides farinae]|uniref:Uncharacterized protein n=1 Tax=Dermatophagoides farinae TaxID=6954 RepID=A0A922I3L1_DERFA|nr:hypothetical protein DERF_005228 [Dermatophagoides farinae]